MNDHERSTSAFSQALKFGVGTKIRVGSFGLMHECACSSLGSHDCGTKRTRHLTTAQNRREICVPFKMIVSQLGPVVRGSEMVLCRLDNFSASLKMFPILHRDSFMTHASCLDTFSSGSETFQRQSELAAWCLLAFVPQSRHGAKRLSYINS